MPTLFIIFGLRFYFWSREHEPIHVHVERDGKEATFNIVPEIELKQNKGLKPKDIKLAESILEENKEIIIEKWREYFGK